MTILLWIIGASAFGGCLSVGCAAAIALSARASWVPVLVSYAIGALLGAAFLEILPHAFAVSQSVETVTATILAGILLFFVLEKLVLWRHYHGGEHPEAMARESEHDHGRSGLMIMVGNTFHNFVDGIIIAAAFLASVQLGIVTSIAIIAHEIPQEIGDFLILLHSGYSKRQALLLNVVSGIATVVGGVLAYAALQSTQEWVPTLLAIAAASMIYVAVADLLPGLHKRARLSETLQQVVLIALGILSIWGTHLALGHAG